jgi:hypothetical protein
MTDAREASVDPGHAGSIAAVMTASNTVSDAAEYRLADDVLLLSVDDGSGRLIDLAGSSSALTPSAAAILDFALRQRSDLACATLATRYRVGEDVIRRDMDGLIQSLLAKGFLMPAATARRTTPRQRLAWLAYPLALLWTRNPLRWTGAKAFLLMTLTFFSVRAFNWTNTVRVLERASAKGSASRTQSSDPVIATTIETAVLRAIARHPLTVSCKERALTAWVLARAAGLPAHVQLGIDLFPFGMHCWCQHGPQIIADRYEGRCDRYTPILTYG